MLRMILASFILAAAGPGLAGPLHDAASGGDTEKARAILDAGADPDAQGDNGETPLNLAILAGHDAVALVLLDAGASVEARNRGGFAPLHAAAHAGAPEIASTLLDRGADVNDRRNKAGVTPLSIAAEEGNAAVAKVLIDRGADIELAEQNGYTPLTRALWRNQEEVVALLQESGARCQDADILGEPAYSSCMAGQR
jgi:uncharacterized protein